MLTRVGPGTAMGALLRRYWVPAALSSELSEPDCPPIRVRLLGEKLVAFRDTRGRVGLVDEFCAHRRASLFLGRNEQDGLRCVYHGWKYDVEGRCVDMPNEPTESNFRDKIRLKAYPTVEMGGLIWAYLGPEEKKPPEPKFEWTQVPRDQRHVSKTWEECNWLQALEGGLDASHVSFLHRRLVTGTSKGGMNPGGVWLQVTAPRLEIQLTDYGFHYATFRPMGERGFWIRVNHFVMPFHQIRPFAVGEKMEPGRTDGHMWVPLDDTNCAVYNWTYRHDGAPLTEEQRQEIEWWHGRGSEEQAADFRKARNRTNDWLIDRRVQKLETFTGIEGINTQDHAVQESMGPIMDRSQEHLGSGDKAIVAARLLLLQAARKPSSDPPGVNTSYYTIRPVDRIAPTEADWRSRLKDLLSA